MEHGWSDNLGAWIKAAGQGQQWGYVTFVEPMKGVLPQKPGVYVICAKAPLQESGEESVPADHVFRELYDAVYVGKSKNLQKRFSEHIANPAAPLKKVKSCFRELYFWWCVIESGDEKELDVTESNLIACLRPIANRQSGVQAKLGEPQSI